MRNTLLALFSLLLVAGPLQAAPLLLDPVVVTATRTATPLSQLGSSVTVITADEIEAKQQTQVLDVLRDIPGVNIVQTGNTGGAVSIYLRGTDTKHTLVMIDGVEFRDIAGFGGADIANLSTNDIERIEVVRGAQSVLYGSDAIGGVINIITKQGSKQPSGYASVEGGSYRTFTEKAGFSVGSDTTSAALYLSRTDTDGFSTANEKDGNSEADGYDNTSASFRLGITPSQAVQWNIILRSTEASYDYDSSAYDLATGGYIPVDGDNVQDVDEKMARVEGTFSFLNERWKTTVGSAISSTKRNYDEEYVDSEYNGTLTKFDLQNTFRVNAMHTLIFGAETENERFDYYYDASADPAYPYTDAADGHSRTNAVYVQEQLTAGAFSTALGVRYDHHAEFGGQTTWRVAPTYRIAATNTRLKGSVGTGFKAPTLFQLYSTYGNKDLDAEKSFGWDAGLEQSFFDSSLIVDIAYFYNNVDDYIDYNDLTFTYGNIAKLKARGIESSLEWLPCEYFDMKIGYTYTDAQDADGKRIDRRPLHKASIDINLYPVDKVVVNLNTIYASAREDGSETLAAYTLVNLAASYQYRPNLKLFARVDNLFDEDYEEVAGYGTAGLSAYAGVKLDF